MILLILLLIFNPFIHPHLASSITVQEQTWIYESYLDQKNKNYPKAIKKINRVLKNQPNHYWLHLQLGYLFALHKNQTSAIAHYEKAAQLLPKSLEPWLALAKLSLDFENFNYTLKITQNIFQIDPFHHLGYQYTIQAHLQLKNYQDALKNAQQALEVYPTDLTFLEQKCRAQKALKLQAAHQTLQFLLLIDPQNAYAKQF